MKTRFGFVSNSSSSSFICEICNHTEVGFDACLEDFGFAQCVHEHIICEEHLLNAEKIEDEWGGECCAESACPICCFEMYSQPELAKYLEEKYKIDKSIVFNKIKEVNKRRKKFYDFEYIEYILKENGLNDDMILEELKQKFGSYSNFINRNK